MRLCSVCDNKIEGKWCKHCHRFVKSYECSSSRYGQDAERETPQATQSGEVCVSGAKTETKETDTTIKKRKTAVVGISLSVLLTSVLPLVTDVFGLLKDASDRAETNRQQFEEEVMLSEEELQAYGDRMKRNTAMLSIEPAERIIDEDSNVRYYNPEDIKEMGYPCDEKHFELHLAEFERWLTEHWTDAYEFEEDSSIYSNLRSIQGENERYRFATYRDYRDGSEFSLRTDFDTATEQLHSVYICVEGASIDIPLYCGVLRQFDPKCRWPEVEFTEALLEAVESGEEYVEFYSSEYVKIAFLKKDGGYSLGYTPGNQ